MRSVYIAGKGPSFSSFDWSNVDGIRVGVNQAAFKIPDCDYATGADRSMMVTFRTLPTNITIIRRVGNKMWRPVHKSVEGPLSDTSGGMAVKYFAKLGHTEFHLIGFDAMRGGSHQHDAMFEKLNPDHDFSKCSNDIRSALSQFNIDPIFEGEIV